MGNGVGQGARRLRGRALRGTDENGQAILARPKKSLRVQAQSSEHIRGPAQHLAVDADLGDRV